MKGIFLLYSFLFVYFVQAQEIKDYTPFSILHNYRAVSNTYKLKPLDLKQIYYEDSIQFINNRQVNIARLQNIKIEEEASRNKFFLTPNQAIWKIKIEVPKAQKIALKIKKLKLPKGSRLFIYSEYQQSNFLVFDATSTTYQIEHFISKTVEGETLILELNQEENISLSASIDIEGLLNYYQKQSRNSPGYGQSTDCEVNVACSEGNGWCNEAQSVVRILIQTGTNYSYCSGAVVNNTKQDFTPYILTAEHCGENSLDEDFKYWRFDFNYQSNSCENPNSESEIITKYLSGCEQIAKAKRELDSGSDFRLVKLLDSIPKMWNIYFAGWDVAEYSSIEGGGVGIHHPYGDIKKISTYIKELVSSDANGGDANDEFWKTYWFETENGYGITEGGSSGSPLFNHQGLIIGTLSTGSSFCDNRKSSPDFYGKMSRHWNAYQGDSTKQLKYWLDPNNTNVLQLGGLSNNKDLICGKRLFFNDFTLFPNPANTILRIGSEDLNNLSNARIDVFDLRGVLVKSVETENSLGIKEINISDLSEAVYILKVTKTDWVIQQKFIILR